MVVVDLLDVEAAGAKLPESHTLGTSWMRKHDKHKTLRRRKGREPGGHHRRLRNAGRGTCCGHWHSRQHVHWIASTYRNDEKPHSRHRHTQGTHIHSCHTQGTATLKAPPYQPHSRHRLHTQARHTQPYQPHSRHNHFSHQGTTVQPHSRHNHSREYKKKYFDKLKVEHTKHKEKQKWRVESSNHPHTEGEHKHTHMLKLAIVVRGSVDSNMAHTDTPIASIQTLPSCKDITTPDLGKYHAVCIGHTGRCEGLTKIHQYNKHKHVMPGCTVEPQ